MTFSSVSQALNQGYAISNVIKSVLRMNTPLAKAIKEAMKQGYNEDQIGEYLEKGKTSSYSQKNQMLKGMTEEEKARGIAYRQPKSEKNIGNILKTAAMAAPVAAAGAVAGPMIGSAMGRMAPTAMNALQRAAPQLMGAGAVPGGAQALAQTGVLGNTPQSPQAAQTIQTTGSIPQNSQQPPLSNANAASIPQPPDIKQPEINNDKLNKLYSGFEKGRDKGFDFESDAFLKVAKRMKSTGEIRSKEDFEKFFNLFDAKKNEGKDLPTALKEASGEYDNQRLAPNEQMPSDQSQEQSPMEPPSAQLDEAKEIEKPKIEKNSVVSSPNGVGEVKEIRNGQAIVEVDGKLTRVKEEDLQPEPEEVKKAKIEFNLDDVDESLRSAPLNEVYAPAHRKHVTIKYNSDVGKDVGKRYIFFKKDGSPVDENLIENLRKGSQLPMTSGKTFWGGWSADTQDSRGTVAYHELTKLAQKEGEEDDPSKPYWFEEEEEVFTHGYSKLAEKKLIEDKKRFDAEEKALNAKNKKPKKKRA